MKKWTAGMITAAGAIILVTALTPWAVADETTTVEEVKVPAEVAQSVPVTEEAAVKGGGDLISIGCLPSTPLTCDDMPSTYNSSCSCSATLQPVRCKSCDGYKGQVLKTTCTVRFACTNPPCDLQQNFTRTAYSCAP